MRDESGGGGRGGGTVAVVCGIISGRSLICCTRISVKVSREDSLRKKRPKNPVSRYPVLLALSLTASVKIQQDRGRDDRGNSQKRCARVETRVFARGTRDAII